MRVVVYYHHPYHVSLFFAILLSLYLITFLCVLLLYHIL